MGTGQGQRQRARGGAGQSAGARSLAPQESRFAGPRGSPFAQGVRCAPGGGGDRVTPGRLVVALYFARSAELAGVRSEIISVPRQLTSLQLWEEIVKRHPRLAAIQDQVVFAVRQEYVLLGDQLLVLQSGDEVAIIPPISGG
ncbi:molybdopterin synthase sulfur carrier subunit-like [Dermochelys coriacea]|uniref:molybdopterin synthase sulfur carrier subunit-like n=1 Tax=Dermochelys coriacea TaxID=27794 RepID=UPI001CA80A65|nr:molybdopterin synthase sulfur carrier subunit-like [Dermochelys coriacea]XP_043371401.1 molybdopterin synthase sulfur carrier subunit-like [Dermochelys coriacea]